MARTGCFTIYILYKRKLCQHHTRKATVKLYPSVYVTQKKKEILGSDNTTKNVFVVLLSSNVIFRLSHADYWSVSPHPFCACQKMTSRDYYFTGVGGSTRVISRNWCPTASYSVIQCHTVSYSIIQCHSMSYSVIQCHSVSYSVIQCHSVIQCNSVSYSDIQCHSVSYSIIQCHTMS
jgi:hypothetical protein